jgi:hypothetical protein
MTKRAGMWKLICAKEEVCLGAWTSHHQLGSSAYRTSSRFDVYVGTDLLLHAA